MLRLRTLGTLDLRDGTGRELRAVLQQPKRLALLAYLAIAGGGRFVRRDTLLGLFWPELDQEHARAALRRALYFLRRVVGEHVVEGRGDDEVRLGAEALWCDAVAFEEALARDGTKEALELYGGPLLEGLYIAGASEAERWLDSTRANLKERAARAAWSLAEAPDAAALEAAEWARLAASFQPDQEDAVARLLRVLDRVGDRAGALHAYETYARRLRLDSELEPSAQLIAQAEAIRRRVDPAAPSAAVPTGAKGPARLIAVLPFSVRGDGSIAYLSEGLVDLLSTALDGAGDWRTVDPTAVLAGQVERSGATHFLRGSVVAVGGRLRVAATLSDQSGRIEGRAEAEGQGEAALFDLVDDLGRQLLTGQEGGPGERLVRLAGLTTNSLLALRAWLQGEHEFRLGHYLPAIDAYQRAAISDESFALAHYRLAAASAASALIEPARSSSRLALRHRERLSERDRLLVEAQHAWLHGSATDAERRYAVVVATHPDDLDAWFLLGDLLFHTNPYRGRSIREAREPLERALRLDPNHVSALVKLARIEALEGRHDRLDSLVNRILALDAASDHALGMRALRAFALRQSEERRAVTEELRTARALTIGITFSDLALYGNDLSAVAALGRTLAESVRSAELQALCRLVLAFCAAASGRLKAAAEELAAAESLDQAWGLEARGLLLALPFLPWPEASIRAGRDALAAWNPNEATPNVSLPLAFHNEVHPQLRAYLLGLLALRLGDGPGVAESAELLAELPEPEVKDGLVERLERSLDAAVHELRGDSSRALSELTRVRSEVWFQLAVASPFYAGAFERFRRAGLLASTGRRVEAIGWLGSIAERSPWEVVFAAPAARTLGELHEQAGDAAAARRERERFVRLWAECDVELKGDVEAVRRLLG